MKETKERGRKNVLPQFSAEEYVKFLDQKQSGKLLTKFGILKEDGVLGELDSNDFLIWVREHRKDYKDVEDLSQADWVIKYKKWLAEVYCMKFHNMAEKLP